MWCDLPIVKRKRAEWVCPMLWPMGDPRTSCLIWWPTAMMVFRVSAQGEPSPNTEKLGKAGKAKSKTYRSSCKWIFLHKYILQYYIVHGWFNLQMQNCLYRGPGGLAVTLHMNFWLRRWSGGWNDSVQESTTAAWDRNSRSESSNINKEKLLLSSSPTSWLKDLRQEPWTHVEIVVSRDTIYLDLHTLSSPPTCKNQNKGLVVQGN